MWDRIKRMVGLGDKARTVAGTPPWTPPKGPPVLTYDDLKTLIHRSGYGEIEAEIMALAVPVFHIIAGATASDAPLGQTRLGGVPDLPVGTAWPKGRFGYATFLGQLDLADVAARTGSSALAPSGLLSLFIVEIEGAADPLVVLPLVTPAGTALERLTPPADAADFTNALDVLHPISIAEFRPGLSIAQADLDRLDLDGRFPDQDAFDFACWLEIKPDGAIGQWLGRGFDNGHGDQRQVAHARRIGHPGLDRFAFITDWAAWEDLKTINNRLQNGTTYRPWNAKDDPKVRWLLDNRVEFDAGAEALQMLIRLESNRPMNLWINDADPIFILIDQNRLAHGDLSEVHATVTQG